MKNLPHLSRFAAFLLKEKLPAFVQKQLQYAFELNVPLLKFFLAMPEVERIAISTQTTTELLSYLAADKASEQIEASLEQWKTNQLPVVDKADIVAEDITLVNHLRKKTMLDFVPGFTTDPHEIIELVKEIDLFTIQAITAATNQYLGLFKQGLEENLHFIQKVAETVPGAVYVFDAEQYKGIYSNNKLPEIIGYSQRDLNALGPDAISTLIHPDDQAALQNQLASIRASEADEEPAVIKYRIRQKDGTYRWLANYESVFKRKEHGEVWQTIGITLNIDNEQKALEELHSREQQLLEAQDIAQMGNYYYDFNDEFSTASPKTQELLEVQPNEFSRFMDKVHPDDRAGVHEALALALTSGQFICEYRICGKAKTKNIWSRGVVDYRAGKAVGITGTVMDITEQARLLQKLAEADQRHKQAEALAHIGTYTRNLRTGEMEWSEEMYRIFEKEINSPLDFAGLMDCTLPEDRPVFEKAVEESIAAQTPFDFYYRIVTKSKKVKILHSRGSIQLDNNGKPEKIVGTDQDVTEKQTLIRRLQKSEALYRQAEGLADMGNWNWDVKTGTLEWTDQLYRIYGLEPQSEKISIERFLSFVHPADKEFVTQGVDALNTQDSLDYTFRIVTEDGTEKWLRSIAQVVRTEEGEIIAIIGTEQNVTEKQKLIGKLEESQRLYKQAQELARMGNFSLNLKTGELFWSDEVYKIHERTYGEKVRFEDAFDPIIEEHKESVRKEIDQTVAEGKGRSVGYAIRTKAGHLKYVNLHTDVTLDEGGAVTCIIGTAQDVTEQEELISRLQESEQLYKQAQSLANMGNWTYDLISGVITWSDELFRIYERPGGQPPTVEEWTSYLDPEEKESTLAQTEEAIRQHKPIDAIQRVKLPNGKTKVLHRRGEVLYDKAGQAVKLVGTTQDVTEQFQTQSDLKQSQTFIQQIADASPTILYSFDVPSQRLSYINREAFFVLGYLPDELIEEGSKVTELLYHPDDLHLLPARTQSKKTFQQVDSMIQYECRMKHKDGDYRWLLVREIVLKAEEDGAIVQITGAALDITRRKEMERTILQNTNQLEQSNASLEEFAYVASHDLKEPLRKISTFGDRLVAAHMDKLNDEGKIYLRKIVDASQRMQNMISDLLSISMISGNRQFEKVSLQKILEETLQTLEFKIEQQKAVIQYENLPEAHVVPSQFRQLFQNLIANSLKFVREGVEPVISIESSIADGEETAAYPLAKAPAYLKLVFSDNGIGFESEYAQKIFAIFHRLHGRSEYEGSGIGLAICKKIVEHHGGVIFASGEPGVGATFTLIVPA